MYKNDLSKIVKNVKTFNADQKTHPTSNQIKF